MPGRLSAWSVASLALLALAVLFFLTAVWYRETTHTSSPGSGAGLLVLLVLCFGAAWTCTLLGAITAWVGV